MNSPHIPVPDAVSRLSALIDQKVQTVGQYSFLIEMETQKTEELFHLTIEVLSAEIQAIDDFLAKVTSKGINVLNILDAAAGKVDALRTLYLNRYQQSLSKRVTEKWKAENQQTSEKKLTFHDKLDKVREFAARFDLKVQGQKRFFEIQIERIHLIEDGPGKFREIENLKGRLQEQLSDKQEDERRSLLRVQDYEVILSAQHRNISCELAELRDMHYRYQREEDGRGIYNAAQSGKVTLLQTAIEAGTISKKTINLPDDQQGFMLLHYAATNNSETTIYLLEQGASPDVKDPAGYQPLHWAAKVGSQRRVRSLINYKANLDARGEYGRTPLHMAAFNGKAECVQILLEAGANPNLHADQEKTPLHDAVINTNLHVVEAFLNDLRTDVMVVDADGHNTVWHATADGSYDILQRLVSHSSFCIEESGGRNSIRELLKLTPARNALSTQRIIRKAIIEHKIQERMQKLIALAQEDISAKLALMKQKNPECSLEAESIGMLARYKAHLEEWIAREAQWISKEWENPYDITHNKEKAE